MHFRAGEVRSEVFHEQYSRTDGKTQVITLLKVTGSVGCEKQCYSEWCSGFHEQLQRWVSVCEGGRRRASTPLTHPCMLSRQGVSVSSLKAQALAVFPSDRCSKAQLWFFFFWSWGSTLVPRHFRSSFLFCVSCFSSAAFAVRQPASQPACR